MSVFLSQETRGLQTIFQDDVELLTICLFYFLDLNSKVETNLCDDMKSKIPHVFINTCFIVNTLCSFIMCANSRCALGSCPLKSSPRLCSSVEDSQLV